VSKRILIADDEAHIRHVLSMKLTNAGYQVLTATDGEEALELVQADKPDLLCTDFQMPYMTGMELCLRLQEDEHTRGMPILMLTARGFEVEQQHMVAAGIADVLGKPFSPREVLEKVIDLIGQADGEEVKDLT